MLSTRRGRNDLRGNVEERISWAAAMSGRSTRRRISSWIVGHPWTSFVVVVAILVAAVANIGGGTGKAPESSAVDVASTTDSEAKMPNLVGVKLVEARAAAPAGYDELDLSSRRRHVWEPANWTVAATVPVAGAPLRNSGSIRLFYLRNAEWDWFQQNPSMPTLPAGVTDDNLADLDGIRELLEYRYAAEATASAGPSPSAEPGVGAQATSTPPPSEDPSVEPDAERAPREALQTAAAAIGNTVVGSLPAAGQKLRLGQLVTVVVKPRPAPTAPPADVAGPSGGSSGLDLGGGYGGGFHIPGHAPGHHCRRFC